MNPCRWYKPNNWEIPTKFAGKSRDLIKSIRSIFLLPIHNISFTPQVLCRLGLGNGRLNQVQNWCTLAIRTAWRHDMNTPSLPLAPSCVWNQHIHNTKWQQSLNFVFLYQNSLPLLLTSSCVMVPSSRLSYSTYSKLLQIYPLGNIHEMVNHVVLHSIS